MHFRLRTSALALTFALISSAQTLPPGVTKLTSAVASPNTRIPMASASSSTPIPPTRKSP